MTKNKQVNEFPIDGRVVHLGQPIQYQNKSGRLNTTRLLVLEVFVDNYRYEVPFDFTDMALKHLDDIKEDNWVHITFRLRGSKSVKDGKTRWFSRNEGIAIVKG